MLLGHPPGLRGRADALAEAYAERAREAGWCVAWADLAFDHEVREINPPRTAAGARPGTAPARLNRPLDRVLLPGWVFRQMEGRFGYNTNRRNE